MLTTSVETSVTLRLEPTAVRDAAAQIFQAIAEQDPPYDRLSLSVGLRDLHFPLEGEIRVPIQAYVENRPLRWESHLDIKAVNNSAFFPKFQGTLTVTPVGDDACEIWLQGTYEPPVGPFGAGIDAILLHGAAKASLQKFLEWLAGEIQEQVKLWDRSRRH